VTVIPHTGSISSAKSPVSRAAAAPLQQPPVVGAVGRDIDLTGFEALFEEQQEASTACALEGSAWGGAPWAWAA
jgi:hypothetical protein